MRRQARTIGRSCCARLRRQHRSGQALIEFAIVAFVLTLLLAGILAMGLLLVSANVLQQAADVAAQELARHPFPATGTFEDEFDSADNLVATGALRDSGLFRQADLIVDPIPATQEDLNTYVANMPLINRLLFPLYVFDPDHNVLRYPGAVVRYTDPVTNTTFPTVLIPMVSTTVTADEAEETIDRWLPVVEEIDPGNTGAGPYSLTSSNIGQLPSGGFVALRINYPYQSAALVGYVRVDAANNVLSSTDVISQDVTNVAVTADDSIAANLPAGYSLDTPTRDARFEASPSRGAFGLGEVLAIGRAVRPYRKVLSAQGIYRREVLLP